MLLHLPQLVSREVYEKLEKKSLQEAQATAKNAFHCKTPDCKGWCFMSDEINSFACPLCKRLNCITCQARERKKGSGWEAQGSRKL